MRFTSFSSFRFEKHPLVVVLAVAIPFLVLMLVVPLPFDNAVYQIMARGLLRYHSIPYFGTWDHNFPGIIYLHYVVMALLGSSDIALRGFDIVLQLCFLVLYFKLWSRWLQPHTAALATVLYILYYVSGGIGLYFERDVLSTMATLASFYFCTSEYRNSVRKNIAFILGGLFSGVSLLMRPHSIVFVGLFSIYLVWNRRDNARRDISSSLLFIFLSLLPCGIVFFYYSQIPGGLSALYYATIRFNIDLYSKFREQPNRIYQQTVQTGFLIPFSLFALIRSKRVTPSTSPIQVHPQKKETFMYATMLLTSIALALVQGKYLQYHFAPIFILLMPSAAVGVELLLHSISNPLRKHYAMLGCIFSCTLIAFVPKAQVGYLYGLLTHQAPLETAYRMENRNPIYGADAEKPVLAFFHSSQNRTGRVEVCSYDPLLRLHLDRHNPGPYPALHALGYRLSGDLSLPPRFASYQRIWQRQYVHILDSTKPRFIVLSRSTAIWYLIDPYLTTLRYCPGFDSLLQTNYKLDTAIGYFQIFEHRNL